MNGPVPTKMLLSVARPYFSNSPIRIAALEMNRMTPT